jgi:hypothetical protein
MQGNDNVARSKTKAERQQNKHPLCADLWLFFSRPQTGCRFARESFRNLEMAVGVWRRECVGRPLTPSAHQRPRFALPGTAGTGSHCSQGKEAVQSRFIVPYFVAAENARVAKWAEGAISDAPG